MPRCFLHHPDWRYWKGGSEMSFGLWLASTSIIQPSFSPLLCLCCASVLLYLTSCLVNPAPEHLQVWLGQGEVARLSISKQESIGKQKMQKLSPFNTFQHIQAPTLQTMRHYATVISLAHTCYIMLYHATVRLETLINGIVWYNYYQLLITHDRMPWQSEHVSVLRCCESTLRIADTEDVCDNKGDCCKWPVFGLQGREWFNSGSLSLYCT